MMGRLQSRTRLASIFLAAFSLLFAGQGHAQVPSQEELRRLLEQRQQAVGQQVTPSPVDIARERAEAERQEMMRQRAAAEVQPLSPLEHDYNERLGRDIEAALEAERMALTGHAGERPGHRRALEAERMAALPADAAARPREQKEPDEKIKPLLRQFGYEVFARPRQGVPTVTGRLPEDYVLGIGDELVVSFVGSTNRTVTTRVDREGRIVLPELPPIPASGRTFGDFRQDLERRVSQALLGTDVFVSVASLRQISVTVLGEVEKPGIYRVTALTDLIELLAYSGGVRKTGSLRRIAVFHGDDVRRIDMYDVLSGRSGADLRVQDGDRVFVPLIGPTAAVAGLAVRPAIYEVPPEETDTVAEILALAGGSVRPRGFVVQRNRIGETGRQILEEVRLDAPLRAGDLFELFPQRNLRVGEVRLSGHVRQQVVRSLEAVPTLSALLGDGDALGPQPYLPFGVLETTDPETRQRLYRPIDLGPVLAGVADVSLRDNDQVFVLGSSELDYLSSPEVRGAILRPEAVTDQSCRSVRVLARRARQADTERFASALRSIFVSESDRREERLEQAADLAADEVVDIGELSRQAAATAQCNRLFDEQPELLALAVEFSTVATGAVRKPGLYPLAGEATLRDLVAAAGGLSLSVDPSDVEISTLRGDGALAGTEDMRRYVSLRETSLAQVPVEPGSAVRFPSQSALLESGTVLLSGEFRHPGVYTIRRGETLFDVIERAGGVTDQAYPYGAVFTRVRVKQEQQESFRRTAREINSALAMAVIKEDVSGEALQAAAGLVQTIATAEAAGRTVVEADPAMLRLNPERDIVLDAGDSVFMPKRPNFVLVAGDVLNPGAMQFTPGKDVDAYLREAGGLQLSADDDRIFVVYPNGEARPVRRSLWVSSNIVVPPGSTIIVPKDLSPITALDIVRDVTQILSQVAISAASLAVIFEAN